MLTLSKHFQNIARVFRKRTSPPLQFFHSYTISINFWLCRCKIEDRFHGWSVWCWVMWWDLKKIISKIEESSIAEHTKNRVFWAIHFVYDWAQKIRDQASRPFVGDVVYTLFYKRSNLRNNLWVNFHLLTSEKHQSTNYRS